MGSTGVRVLGRGRDFMRVFAEETWGIFKEDVIGCSAAYEYKDGRIVRTDQMLRCLALGRACTRQNSTGSSRPSRGPSPRSLSFEAAQIRHTDWGVPGQAYAVFLVKPNTEVLAFQAALLAAVTPFVGSGGTPAAFVTDADGDINETTLKWVEQYVPDQIGSNYIPHISLGFATLDDLKVIEAETFTAFAVHPASIAVYHLGNNGNARTELKSWKV